MSSAQLYTKVDGGVQKRGTRPPFITRGIARIVLNVKNYFKKENDHNKRISLGKVTERVVEATGISRATVCKISSESDLENFQ